MAQRPTSPSDDDAADELLALALSRPHDALARARGVLAAAPTPGAAAVAHQAIGLVLRQFGDVHASVVELTTAKRWARRGGDLDRAADISGTLGLALALAGRPARGLTELDRAVAGSRGVLRGRILVRRAHVLWLVGRSADALRDARSAVQLLAGHGDLWEARAVSHRAMAHLALGDIRRADRDFARSEDLFEQCGQVVDHAFARHERGVTALARGDLPLALSHFEDAQARFARAGVFEPQVTIHKCAALLWAGLAPEALAEARRGLDLHAAQQGTETSRAELLLTAAVAAFDAGDPAEAEQLAVRARGLFRRQQRTGWAIRADLLAVRCTQARGGAITPGRLRRVRAAADRLHAVAADHGVEAHLLAGQLCLDRGRREPALEHLTIAARARRRSSPVQALGWLARAALCDAQGRSRPMLAACRRGLEVLEQHLQSLGATELRSLATGRGTDLAALALRHVAAHGTARQLLEWSERWRAVVLTIPPVRPSAASPLVAELAALRQLTLRLADEGALPLRTAALTALHHERHRLERAVRERTFRSAGAGATVRPTFRTEDLLAELGTTSLVELVRVNDALVAVVVGRGGVRRVPVGTVAAAERAVAQALFALRREGAARGTQRLDLMAIGARLEREVLGSALRLTGDADVVVVPPGRLHACPWGLLPGLQGRAVTVSPSAAAWLRARRERPPAERSVVLVGGPALSTGTEEVLALADRYPQARLLAGRDATAENVIAAVDGAWLAHLAAHGTFRADSPLFSSVLLDDGPLTVYDLERLRRAPHRVILSSCSSAVGAPTGSDELLGFVSALVARGCAGVVASVVPVDDPSTVPLMLALHAGLADGRSLGASLAAARAELSADPKLFATAASFVAFGA